MLESSARETHGRVMPCVLWTVKGNEFCNGNCVLDACYCKSMLFVWYPFMDNSITTQNATCMFVIQVSDYTNCLPLHMPCFMRELFRNMARTSCCNGIELAKQKFNVLLVGLQFAI